MGSESTPANHPALIIATVLHDLDVAHARLDDEHRAGLVRAVGEWVRHHDRSNPLLGPVEATARHLAGSGSHDGGEGVAEPTPTPRPVLRACTEFGGDERNPSDKRQIGENA